MRRCGCSAGPISWNLDVVGIFALDEFGDRVGKKAPMSAIRFGIFRG